jgi:EAL domain-containing protein (putative c-di-GMP-specific phosphodiesterase class I)
MQAMVQKTTSSDTSIGARAALQAGIERIYARIPQGPGWAHCTFNNLTLRSNFQPIFSVARQACVAYEGLLRAENPLGKAVSPESVFAIASDMQGELYLDWLCRALHLRNFQNLGENDALIFINAYPAAAIEDPRHPREFAQMIANYSINPATVVIEILETGVSDEAQLIDAVSLYRRLGCRIAIDDFGVGYSNFDRLWRLRPDFVKIDRSVIVSATREAHARLVLAQMIKLIQQCGAKVIVEGIETRGQALTALDAGADFLQGYYMARPGVAAMPHALCDNLFAELVDERAPLRATRVAFARIDLAAYADSLKEAVKGLRSGNNFEIATANFLALPQVARVYLTTVERTTPAHSATNRGSHLKLDIIESAANEHAAENTSWALDKLQQVIRRAVSIPGQVHVSPDAGVAGPAPQGHTNAVTLSSAFEFEDRTMVLCGDLLNRREFGLGSENPTERRNAA